MRDGCNSQFFISGYFLPFTLHPPNDTKNQNFTKMKKAPEDVIILHMCTKNNDYMMYASWNVVRDGRMDGKSDI